MTAPKKTIQKEELGASVVSLLSFATTNQRRPKKHGQRMNVVRSMFPRYKNSAVFLVPTRSGSEKRG